MSDSRNITEILEDWGNGNSSALEELIPLVYEELHRLAQQVLRKERPNHTLQPTALIHETYLKLFGQYKANFQNRKHFYAVSSKLMRRILVDHARAKKRNKRGGKEEILSLDETQIIIETNQNIDLIALDEALNRLENLDPRQARIVELKYFSGLSLEETAEILDISRSSVAQDWAIAKAWLFRELTK